MVLCKTSCSSSQTQDWLLDQFLCQGALAENLQPNSVDCAAVAIVELGDNHFDPRPAKAGHELLVG